MKTKLLFSIIFFIIIFGEVKAQAYCGVDVSAIQSGNFIKIHFNLSGILDRGQNGYDITVYCSIDDTTKWDALYEVSGDVGSGIQNGKNKMILWDVLKEKGDEGLVADNVRFKINTGTGCGCFGGNGNGKNVSNPKSFNIYNATKFSNPPKSTKNIVRMQKENGVYKVPIVINGVEMTFIFDTGASDISLSTTEYNFLVKQKKISSEDILGTQKYKDATGNITECTIVNLKTVKIGNKIINNIQASIQTNQTADILLGESALDKFGKITIDYSNLEIIFE